MRVLLVTNDYPPKPGGIQQYLGNIVTNAAHPIRVLGPREDEASPEEGVRRGDRRWMVPSPAVRRWILGEAQDFAADVIVFGAPHPLAQLGPSIREASGLPYAVMAHGAEITVPGAIPGIRQALAHTVRAADGLFAVSAYTARAVEAMRTRPVVVLGAGVDLDRFAPAATAVTEPLVLGCVSRFVARKGHGRVIEAGELLADRGHDVQVLLAGRGRLEDRLRRRAFAARVKVDLRVDVAWSDLPSIYRSMTAFAMPVRDRWAGLEVEGLGIVYLEALASGVPVIAGTSGGAPETVRPAQTGFIATSPEDVADAFELIVADLDRYRAQSRDEAERHYSWRAVMDRWNAELGRIVQTRRKAR